MTFRCTTRLMRIAKIAVIVCTGCALAWSQVGQLKTAEGLLEKYKQPKQAPLEPDQFLQANDMRAELELPIQTGGPGEIVLER